MHAAHTCSEAASAIIYIYIIRAIIQSPGCGCSPPRPTAAERAGTATDLAAGARPPPAAGIWRSRSFCRPSVCEAVCASTVSRGRPVCHPHGGPTHLGGAGQLFRTPALPVPASGYPSRSFPGRSEATPRPSDRIVCSGGRGPQSEPIFDAYRCRSQPPGQCSLCQNRGCES